ncbi:MAG: hypothetical protein KIT22_05220, partial [Verrucomicrobiae bacterium]|nr:hypothetical protein [Verrucomicrobiae bacterium]
NRFRLLSRIERRLLMRRFPRLEMTLLLGFSGMAAALASFLLLQAGLESMALRYPIAVAAGYGAFLLLLRLWLRLQADGPSVLESADGGVDLCDAAWYRGGGTHSNVDLSRPLGESKGLDPGSGWLDLDAEELGLLCIVLLAAAAGVLTCLYLIWVAPSLLAELLVDGLILSGVHRVIGLRSAVHWLPGVFRRTWFPAVCLMFFVGLSGFALHRLAPDAVSIGPAVAKIARGRGEG